MATSQDYVLGIKKESTYGTPVTVDRFYPWHSSNDFSGWDPRPRQGQGVLGGNGRHTDAGGRWYTTAGQGTLKTTVELESKGCGVILDLALGVSAVNAITGGAQMVFHPQLTGTRLPSATIQCQTPMNDGNLYTQTFAGCTATKVTIEQPADGIPTVEVEWDALSRSTATAAATPTYASSPLLFDAYQATCGYDGNLTVPTNTALGSGLTSSPVWRTWKLEIDHGVNVDGWVLNGGTRSQPAAGKPTIKFSGTAEVNDTTLLAAYTSGTINPWYTTYTTTQAISAGYAQLQVVIPALAIIKGLPAGKPTEVPLTVAVEGEVKWDGTNRDLYVAFRSLDTAL